MDAQHFATGAYIILLIALVFFIALSATLIFALNRKLKSTLGREGKGAAYSRAVLLAHEDERARISRDLHDTIAQDLRGLSLQLTAIGKAVGEKEREELRAASAQLLTLVDRVRITCNHLVPPNFRFLGIQDALSHLCYDFGKRTGIECRADIAEGPAADAIDEKMQLQIYRIIQEALTNVAKHAQAAEVTVMYRRGADGSIRVGVFDDGAGFDATDFTPAAYNGPIKTMGIRGMEERAAILKGKLDITSEPGMGTSLRLVIPPERGPKERPNDESNAD